MLGKRRLRTKEITLLNRKAVPLNHNGTTVFCFAEAEVEISLPGEESIRHVSRRGVILTPNGAQVLPYFWNGKEWKVVMVEQFRIAVPGKTLEGPGGQVDWPDVPRCMAEEIKEETGIVVDPSRIEIVFCEYMWSSMTSARAWGGIVEISKADIPEKVLWGEFMRGEYMAVVVWPLAEILRLRDQKLTSASYGDGLDLWTSRLLDEVAKKTGLLVRNY